MKRGPGSVSRCPGASIFRGAILRYIPPSQDSQMVPSRVKFQEARARSAYCHLSHHLLAFCPLPPGITSQINNPYNKSLSQSQLLGKPELKTKKKPEKTLTAYPKEEREFNSAFWLFLLKAMFEHLKHS